MCGRFVLQTAPEMLAEAFDAPDPPKLAPRYNVAPSQLVAVVGLKADMETRGIALLRWGLVPYWSNGSGPRPINARAESVAFKFGESLREKRCLIPADGFYEWVAEGNKKRARHFSMTNDGVFAFAGLWDVWRGEKTLVTTCLVTTSANDRVIRRACLDGSGRAMFIPLRSCMSRSNGHAGVGSRTRPRAESGSGEGRIPHRFTGEKRTTFRKGHILGPGGTLATETSPERIERKPIEE